MEDQYFDAMSNGFHRSSGGIEILRSQEAIETDAEHLPGPAAIRSVVAFRRINVVALFKLGQPGISLIGLHVLPGRAVGLPSLEGILSKRFPLFFTIDLLDDCLSHHPMGRALTRIRQAFHAGLGVIVDFDRYGPNGSNSHDSLQIRYYIIIL